jgi:predicted RNase H-like HicB family nuclease
VSDYQYTVFLDPDPETGAHTVTVPALPGCITQGDTLEDAIAMAKEAISLHIEGLPADGQPVPRETERPQAITVSVAVEPASVTSA